MIDWDTYHLMFGAHSGIPLCCINFFVNVWDKRRLWEQDRRITRAVKASSVEYVQCPSCVRHKRVARLRICRNECWGNCMEDFKALCSEDVV
jgi:hypothetical protein